MLHSYGNTPRTRTLNEKKPLWFQVFILVFLVRLRGFEPLTYGLEVRSYIM